MPPLDPALGEFASSTVAAVLGAGSRVVRVDTLQDGRDRAVLLVTVAEGVTRSRRRLVLKVAGPHAAPAVDFERTAAVSTLARAAGAPVPAVLAADASHRAGRWRYLLAEHVEGVEWRRVRPLLDPGQLRTAHRQIAEAVLAVQSVRFASFGELDARGRLDARGPAGADLRGALHHRAELRIADRRRQASFRGLLDREAGLFAGDQAGQATLCHDDLHHGNVVFRADGDRWRLAGLLDWDKAWAGPGESDVARMAFWDDMTGPGFWEAYRAAVPAADGWAERAPVYQLLWCLEYDDGSARHAADTAALCRRLGVELHQP